MSLDTYIIWKIKLIKIISIKKFPNKEPSKLTILKYIRDKSANKKESKEIIMAIFLILVYEIILFYTLVKLNLTNV